MENCLNRRSVFQSSGRVRSIVEESYPPGAGLVTRRGTVTELAPIVFGYFRTHFRARVPERAAVRRERVTATRARPSPYLPPLRTTPHLRRIFFSSLFFFFYINKFTFPVFRLVVRVCCRETVTRRYASAYHEFPCKLSLNNGRWIRTFNPNFESRCKAHARPFPQRVPAGNVFTVSSRDHVLPMRSTYLPTGTGSPIFERALVRSFARTIYKICRE